MKINRGHLQFSASLEKIFRLLQERLYRIRVVRPTSVLVRLPSVKLAQENRAIF